MFKSKRFYSINTYKYFLSLSTTIVSTVKPELTPTSEEGPPFYNDHHFESPFGTFITIMTSEKQPPVNNGQFSWVQGWSLSGLTVLVKEKLMFQCL